MGFDLEQCYAKGYEIEDLVAHHNIKEAILGKDIVCTDSLPENILGAFKDCQVTKEIMEMANEGEVLASERRKMMRLFHVSEEENIKVFEPRIPDRNDLDKTVGLVWAIDEARLPNFLTPRNCPRVTYHVGKNTTEADKQKFFTSKTASHAIIIESRWFEQMKNTTLYLYEFEVDEFELQDDVAGYYVAKTTQVPKAKYQLDDLFAELIKRNIEIRITDNLWKIADEVKASTLNWSLCRMGYARRGMFGAI